MRGILEPEYLLLILLTVLVMFGGTKIPELAAGLGKGVREFKQGFDGGADLEPASRTTIVAPPPAPESQQQEPKQQGPKRLLQP